MEPLECLKLDLPRPETIITEEEWERAKKEINAKMEIFDMECKMALGRAISSARDSYVCGSRNPDRLRDLCTDDLL